MAVVRTGHCPKTKERMKAVYIALLAGDKTSKEIADYTMMPQDRIVFLLAQLRKEGLVEKYGNRNYPIYAVSKTIQTPMVQVNVDQLAHAMAAKAMEG